MAKYLAIFWVVLISENLAAQDHFHIRFERSGGFTGISREVELDSRFLPSEEEAKLKELILIAGFFEYQQGDSTAANVPDQFQYTIIISHPDEKKTVTFYESNIPKGFRPLINYLLQKARK